MVWQPEEDCFVCSLYSWKTKTIHGAICMKLADVGYVHSSSVSQLGFKVKVPCLAY